MKFLFPVWLSSSITLNFIYKPLFPSTIDEISVSGLAAPQIGHEKLLFGTSENSLCADWRREFSEVPFLHF